MSVNPIGKIISNPELDAYILSLKQGWDAFILAASKVEKITTSHVSQYLMQSLDGLILFVNAMMRNESGADKKATVLAALTTVYVYVAVQTFPFWLKPFSAQIQDFAINVLASAAIDWIVSKYDNGSWTGTTA